MLTKPKQIVLDKSAFNAFKDRQFDALCDFAKQHILLVSDTLLYECATAEKDERQDPVDLLTKYECLIEKGAYYCSMSLRFIEWEAGHCQPYPWLLADLEKTKCIRNGQANVRSLLDPGIADEASDKRRLFARRVLLEGVLKVLRETFLLSDNPW